MGGVATQGRRIPASTVKPLFDLVLGWLIPSLGARMEMAQKAVKGKPSHGDLDAVFTPHTLKSFAKDLYHLLEAEFKSGSREAAPCGSDCGGYSTSGYYNPDVARHMKPPLIAIHGIPYSGSPSGTSLSYGTVVSIGVPVWLVGSHPESLSPCADVYQVSRG